ncbi:hypothetical protein [Burkholderia gladioli]|uniref:hypothetical protein n=1 Tax=Burkholderia gladioli TaxID=28095 RepID=UPI001641D06E|nr:hypothetical protein [Burkholderia gladioli]MDN7753749.1 hypothetical protein [Burkholderia gladioli]
MAKEKNPIPGITGLSVQSLADRKKSREDRRLKKTQPSRIVIDLMSLFALALFVGSEFFFFPLADKEFTDRSSTLVVELALLGGRTQDSMEKFDTKLAEFKVATYGKPRDVAAIGIDLDRILAYEVQYLRYFIPAGMVLVDELDRLKLLTSQTTSWEKTDEGKQILEAVKKIKLIQPRLNKCYQDALSRQQTIDGALSEGPNDKTRVDLSIASINSIGDLFKGKTGRWMTCRSDLEEFDRQLVSMTANYSFVVEQLENRAIWDRRLRLILKALATLILAICGATYRNKWLKAATKSFGG